MKTTFELLRAFICRLFVHFLNKMNGGRDHEASAKRNQIINADCVRRIAQRNLNPAMAIINLYFVPKLDYPQAVKVDVERDTFSKSRLTFCTN